MSIFLLALTSFCLFYYLTPEKIQTPKDKTMGLSADTHDHKAKTNQKNKIVSQKKDPTSSGSTQDDEVTSFSYPDEVENVRKLSKKLPQSESQLIRLITKEDYFKAHAKEVKPHSFDEITQNQMGAVKVLALKALMSQEYSSGNIQRSLDTVIQTAKDPAIVNIAKAALDSVKKGRPFFKDFVEGIDGMPF